MTFQFPTLPKPDILDETAYEAILKRKLDLFRAKRPDYTNLVEGDLVYVMAEVAAYDELNMRKQMNNTYLQTLILFASGTNLDNLVANIGLTRQVKKEAVFDENGGTHRAGGFGDGRSTAAAVHHLMACTWARHIRMVQIPRLECGCPGEGRFSEKDSRRDGHGLYPVRRAKWGCARCGSAENGY